MKSEEYQTIPTAIERISLTPELLSHEIISVLEQKKAENLLILNLQHIHSYFNYFLLATATSQAHLKSLVRDIRGNFLEYLGDKSGGIRREDIESGWVIIDFIDPVVHIFLEEQRQFYNLERLWGDAEFVIK